jgi:predicted Zn-dependent protease
MRLDAVPDGPGSAALTDELEAVAHRVGRFIKRLEVDADDVELWLHRRGTWGWRVDGRDLEARMAPRRDTVAFRVDRDGRVGAAQAGALDEAAWQRAVHSALGALAPDGRPLPPAPAARRPGPMTFDPELADQLAPARALHRVASALVDNTWHEAERIPGLARASGEVRYVVDRYVVASTAGVVASLHAHLRGHIELNGAYGDVMHQTHAPESYLPLALLGARTWRTMPRAHVTPTDLGLTDALPVVLHPRVLEQLVRRVGPVVFDAAGRPGDQPALTDGAEIAAPGVTLVDDPGLDGLSTSRPFDDEGVPTRRTPLLVRGRVTQLWRTRAEAARTGAVPSGCAWRRAEVAPAGEPPRPRPGFGSVLMERGEVGFHDIVASVDRAILVHALDDLRVDPVSGGFRAKVRWGVTLENDRESRLLAPGAWRLSGNLFSLPGAPAGLLEDALLSRELYDTGTGILPYCFCQLDL